MRPLMTLVLVATFMLGSAIPATAAPPDLFLCANAGRGSWVGPAGPGFGEFAQLCHFFGGHPLPENAVH